MSRAAPLVFTAGFGLLLGSSLAQLFWPETADAAISVACIGIGIIVFTILFPENPRRP